MFSTFCHHCGQPTSISPDNPHCAHCNHDLHDALPQSATVRYFYSRATDLANKGSVLAALDEAERGFAATQTASTPSGDSSLRLLAAMLAQRLDRPDLMRHHVAHIELDDALRSEAEWLLRSHQAGRRIQRQLAKTRRTTRSSGQNGVMLAPQSAAVQSSSVPRNRIRWASASALVIVLLAGISLWAAWRLLAPVASSPAVAEQPVPTGAATDQNAGALSAATATAAATPTSPPQLAADATDVAIEALASQPFDWRNFLTEQGENELAALPVDARIVDDVLRLEGSVETNAQRQQLVVLAETLPDVDEVNLVNLRVDLPETYTARQGDTIWLIAIRLYGDVDRVEDLLAANRDRLLSPESLQAGQELVVPE